MDEKKMTMARDEQARRFRLAAVDVEAAEDESTFKAARSIALR
jgi:hypothetical protein